MKEILKKIGAVLRPVKPLLEALAQAESALSASWASGAHRRLFLIQWGIPPNPEHFDHHIDLHDQWSRLRNSQWLERGVFSSLCLQGGSVLEIACGDGFNARNFYSLRSSRVVACDFDPKAIRTARRKNSATNVEYVLADIRHEMPKGKYENIIWDAAIEHFTPDEIQKLLKDIKSRLADNGILSGYTMVENSKGKALSQHEYEFKDKQDLFNFLRPHFKKVTVFETIYPTRHNLYFWASDSTIPLRHGWPNMITECD